MILTTRLIIDAWSWIEYLSGSELGKKVDRKIAFAAELWTSSVSVAEIVSKYRRKNLDETVALDAVRNLSKVSSPDLSDAAEAGRIHSEVRKRSPNFSIADAFALQLARRVGGKVLTGDPDFGGLEEAEFLR